MLTFAIIVGSVVIAGSAITIASLSFTKWYMERVEGYEPEPKPKSRLDTLQVFTSACEVEKCPFCSTTRRQGAKEVVTAEWFRVNREAGKLSEIQSLASKSKAEGTTSVVAVTTVHGVRLYQGCTRCGGEWLLKRPEKKEMIS